MSSSIILKRLPCVLSLRALALTAILISPLACGRVVADDAAKANGAVAKSVTETGSIIRREAVGKPWQVVAKDEAVRAGDLLIGLPGAALESSDGKVRLAFRPDLSGHAPLPIIETAVVLHQTKDDLELTLDRGRIDLTNTAKEGAAKVRLQIRDKVGEITLKAPGSRLGIEMFGRWAAGSKFHKEGDSGQGPMLNLIFLVFHGEVDIKTDRHHFAMTAPKGPAMLTWNSVAGADPAPEYLEQLPDWAKQEEITPQVRERIARRDELIRLIEKERDSGVFLSLLGVGNDNYKDAKMEKLADDGNGNYSYVDSLSEARKVLVSQIGATLVTVAKDVKLQIEFNPNHVKAW